MRDVILPTTVSGGDTPVRQPKSNGQKTILVVDDDTELREYISGHFRRHFKVKSASDGGEALRMIAESAPDLIISDVMMPGVDGLTLLHRLKKNADTHHIPVVLLSSKQDITDRMAGWDRGADGYLGKPFHIEELEALVDNLIDNRLRMKGKFSGTQDTEGKISAPEMKGNDEALLERVLKIIDQNIEDPKLNVEKLASDVGLSRAHLHRKMKDMVGMTPSDFVRTIRIRRACELLRKGDVAVTQVAYKVGFTSQPHFSTIFKSFTGFTPSEYRDGYESGQLPDTAEPRDPTIK
ncbi:MAG: response regulator [Muribaculaceae bacterium]|nr:response regulator [Muribaculaceae bacterium]